MGAMPAASGRAAFQRRRPTQTRSNNSLRRTYDLLRSSLHHAIEPGSVLVEEELIDALSASRNTVRAALQLLADQGLVTRRPRLGTTARASMLLPFDGALAHSGGPADGRLHAEAMKASIIDAPTVVSRRLELTPGAPVALVEGVVFEQETPIGVSSSYVGLPAGVEPQVGRLPDVITLLEDRLHVGLGECDTMVAAVPCDDQTAALLGLALGAPMLWLEDFLRDADGRPRAVCELRYRGDCVAFSAVAHRGEPAPDPPPA